MIASLHDSYKNVNIYKTLKRNDCDFQLKPLIYEIHGNYLKTNINTTKSIINEYLNTLQTERVVFVLKYYL